MKLSTKDFKDFLDEAGWAFVTGTGVLMAVTGVIGFLSKVVKVSVKTE